MWSVVLVGLAKNVPYAAEGMERAASRKYMYEGKKVVDPNPKGMYKKLWGNK